MREDSDFVDPTYDFGFKRLMKDTETVIAFLNALLPFTVKEIKSSSASEPSTRTQSQEALPARPASMHVTGYQLDEQRESRPTADDKTVIFDFVCTTNEGQVVNVEMQKSSRYYYFHRALYYSSRILSRHGYRGKSAQGKPWNWELNPVYHIAILDFPIHGLKDIPKETNGCWKVWSRMCIDPSLCQPNGVVQVPVVNTDVLNICLLCLPEFNRIVKEVATEEERFMWIFKNLGNSSEIVIPGWARFGAYQRIVKFMKKEALSKYELSQYELEIRKEKDAHDIEMTARMKGRQEGLQEGRQEGRQEGMMALYRTLKALGKGKDEIRSYMTDNFGNDSENFLEAISRNESV